MMKLALYGYLAFGDRLEQDCWVTNDSGECASSDLIIAEQSTNIAADWRQWFLIAFLLQIFDILLKIFVWWPAVFKNVDLDKKKPSPKLKGFLTFVGFVFDSLRVAFYIWGITLRFGQAGEIMSE